MAPTSTRAWGASLRRATGPVLGALLLATVAAIPAAAQTRVQVHGFLTQGYGSATDYPIYGISTGGTADYRTLALQGRFFITSSDQVVAQISNQRLGNSLFMQFEEDVALDWLFYQKRFLGNSIRVGRVPMPRGLFNEVRNVGTILPFFRASKAFYSEGVETVDGVTMSRSIGFGEWTADATVSYGEFDVRAEITDENGLGVVDNKWTRSVGGQLTVSTPVPGVRFGGSYLRARIENTDKATRLWTLYADGSFERVFVRGEYEIAGQPNYTYEAYYAQAGVNVWKGLWINGQAEFNNNTIGGIPVIGELDIPSIKDYAASMNYRVNTHLTLKGEWHTFKGYQVGVPLDPFGPPVKDKYYVLGIAAAF